MSVRFSAYHGTRYQSWVGKGEAAARRLSRCDVWRGRSTE
jgi:hypothetical protein